MKERKLFQPIYMHMITWFLKKCKWCADKILKLESVG